MLLLNPGPVTVSERVRGSLAQPDLCHRESEFFDLQDEARARLLAVYGLDAGQWSAVLMTASGTGAVESMMASLVPRMGRVLVVDNGVYGERIAQICAQYQIAHERLTGEWLAAPDVAAIRTRLQGAPAGTRFTHLAIVHHETTTGRLNDLQPLSQLCAEQGAQLLVDGVSSFGAERIDFTDPTLTAVAGTANKCLHGVPGIAFVIVRASSLATAESRTYYLDLARLARAQQQRNTPFTPAVQACYALVEALREYHEQGGRSARHHRYAQLAEQVRAGLAVLRVQPLIAPEHSSVVLRAYRLPERLGYQRLHDALKQDGFVIYAGQGRLAPSLFRISTMGELTTADMDRLLAGVGRLLQ
ncbi:MAG TPA: 2-aminoethylphosphonate aminotransferase [Steroidobacteraceae bacterium]